MPNISFDNHPNQASEYSRSLIEASRDPLFTINLEGIITDVNEASVKATGLSRENLIGTYFEVYFTEPQKAEIGYKLILQNGFISDYPLTIIDGHLTDVLFNGAVYKDESGKILGAVCVARDITEQKRIEQELTEAKIFAELTTIIAEEAKNKAEIAVKIAENAVKTKQQFLSNMSHEIRTPMNAIVGFTKVILKTELTSQQREYLNAIKISGDALIVLINDILDLAKIEAGKMTFEKIPFNISNSITTISHLFETKIQEKNLALQSDYDKNIPKVLLGDPVRLHQVLINLVGNAVKFTAKGGISISTRLKKEDDQTVTIEFAVTDTGIGIEKEKLGKIFENFQQSSCATNRLFGGTGLGLSIVKQLVESQGGSIHVKSKLYSGSTFTVSMHFDKTTATLQPETITHQINTQNQNISVLVVEDMALNQLLMKTLLDDFGFERKIASNGKLAIEMLKKGNYDIILMDLQMPIMNGFEATEYIRNTMKSKIPIIALTADVTTVDLEKCKSIGMNDYISKPIDERLLYNKIVGLVLKSTAAEIPRVHNTPKPSTERYTNLTYLAQRTKSDPILMSEMINAYLQQTPVLLAIILKSYQQKDWGVLHSAIHKMIPSFVIMGISNDYEAMARKVMEHANALQQKEDIHDMVTQIEIVCQKACIELELELISLKHTYN